VLYYFHVMAALMQSVL